MSKIKTENNRDNRRDIELPPNAQSEAPVEAEEQTSAEKLLMASQPYWTQIILGVLVSILAWVIISYLTQASREAAAEPSRQLADAIQQFRITNNVDSLKQMKTDYPNEVATNWAMVVAGDYELNRGLRQFASDREEARRLIERAKETFQGIVDSPSTAKTTMQQRRSLYSLAYANESLGNFDAAKTLYQRVLDDAPDSIFVDSATRGLARASNPEFKKLYDDFASYKPASEDAPGVAVPEAPVIDFPEIDLPETDPVDNGMKSDDMKSTDEVAKPATDSAQNEADESENKSTEQESDEVNADEVMTDIDEAAQEAQEAAETVKEAVTE